MPIYTFVCTECKKTEDRLVKVAEANTMLTCNTCGSDTMKRELSMTTSMPVFKGSGYYQTDFKGK